MTVKASRGELFIQAKILKKQLRTARYWIDTYQREIAALKNRIEESARTWEWVPDYAATPKNSLDFSWNLRLREPPPYHEGIADIAAEIVGLTAFPDHGPSKEFTRIEEAWAYCEEQLGVHGVLRPFDTIIRPEAAK